MTEAMTGIEKALSEAQHEIRRLKEMLVIKDTQYHDLEMDNRFYQVKTSELSGILQQNNNVGRKDKLLAKSLETKATENAELTVRVQELRKILNTTLSEKEQLDSDLKLATTTVSTLAEQRKTHQRMLVELSDVVREIGKIQVKYDKTGDNANATSWMDGGDSFENIKRKIHAIEEDRQRNREENDILRSEIEARDERISGLQRQIFQLEATSKEHRDNSNLLKENERLKEECAGRDNKINALEELFTTINRHRSSADDTSIPTNVAYEHHGPGTKVNNQDDETVGSQNLDSQTVSGDDGTEIVLNETITNLSATGYLWPTYDDAMDVSCMSEVRDEDDSSLSVSTLEASPVVDGGEANMQDQMSLLKDKYRALKQEHAKTEERVQYLETQLHESKNRVKMSKKKQDLREDLLREVIGQYKELQGDHDEATSQIVELQGRLQQAQHYAMYYRTRVNRKKLDELGIRGKSIMQQQEADDSLELSDSIMEETMHTGTLEETITFELSEDQSEVTSMHSMSTTNGWCTEQLDEEEDIFSVHSVECFDEDVVNELNRLDCEVARLEHEYDNAIARISNLEDELKTTQDEKRFAILRQRALEDTVQERELELTSLRQDYETAIDKYNGLQEKLKTAQNKADQSNRRQKAREEDLLSVIRQYKQVTEEKAEIASKLEGVEEEKEEILSKLKSVERELVIVRKQAKRGDLIYDFKRLQRQHNDVMEDIEGMKKQVKRAQAEAVQSKADAKTLRKRMTGSNFHFKKLQQEYNEILTDKVRMERELTRTKNEVTKFKAQEDCWTAKITGIREKRKEAEKESKQLKEQNVQLKSYCNNILLVAAQGMPDDDPLLTADATLEQLLT